MASSTPKKSTYIDSLHLSEKEQQALLNRLREEEAQKADRDRRTDRRLEYRISGGLILQVRHPGGSVSNYLVHTRNLSRFGLGFLHGNFLHTGTPCVVSLRRSDKSIATVSGEIRRCRLVSGRVHEIGVHFAGPIELNDYVTTLLEDNHPEKPSVEMPSLAGRVLYVDDSINDLELIKFQLHTLGMEVITVTNGPEALMRSQAEKFDMIMTGVWLAGMTGPELAMSLRERGYKGPILALSADTRPETRKQAIEWGCTQLLIKPYHFEDLVGFIHHHLHEKKSGGSVAHQVLRSAYWSNRSMRPLIIAFLERLSQQIESMEKQLTPGGNRTVLEKMCLDLKGSAAGYGYPQITEQADALFQKLTAKAPADQLQQTYHQLAQTCRKAIAMLTQADAA